MNKTKGGLVLNNWKVLLGIGIVVFIGGWIAICVGIYQKNAALAVSGIGLIGSYVGMHANSANIKRQAEQDRHYFIFSISEERYGVLQIGVYNAGNNGLVITEINLDRDLYLMIGGKTLNERLINTAIPAKEKVLYPYDVEKDQKKSDLKKPYVDVSGVITYHDFSGKKYKNNILLNLSSLSGQLMHKRESIKRDYEIIQASKAIQSINTDIEELKKHFTK